MREDRAIKFVTGNHHKFKEADRILSKYGIKIVQSENKTLEIQADRLEEVVYAKAAEATSTHSPPLLVEDAGLFITALNGFPGPYSSYVFRTIGLDGVLKLLEGRSDRNAEFRSSVAYVELNARPRLFHGKAEGAISPEKRGTGGFGYDPIFIPEAADGRCFAEMSFEEKNQYSHRSMAFKAFADWYNQRMSTPS